MKLTTFSVSLLLLISTLCLSFTSASQCGPGQYYQNGPVFNRGCFACPVGFYCPGDDSTHQCSPGSIAAQEGSVSCSACPSNFNTNPQQTKCEKCATGRMTVDEHFCLLSDTPLSAVQFTNNVAVMNSNQLMSFAEVDFAENDYSHRGMTQLTLYNPNGLRFMVYASSTTGRPGPLNYEYFGFGANVTLAIKGTADIPSLIYFNITVIPEKVIPFPIKLITKSYDMIVDQRVPVVEGMNSITLDTHFEGEVIVEYYNKKENDIQFTFNTGGEYMFYHVFYSSNQDVEYPNPNNSDFVYYSGDARQHPSVTVNAVGRRQGVVRVAFQTKYGKGDVIQVQVVLKK